MFSLPPYTLQAWGGGRQVVWKMLDLGITAQTGYLDKPFPPRIPAPSPFHTLQILDLWVMWPWDTTSSFI